MGTDLEVRVLRGLGHRDPKGTARRRAARTALKEAGSETHASTNRNRISGAMPVRASGQNVAKLSRPKTGDVDPAAVWRQSSFLPGEASLHV